MVSNKDYNQKSNDLIVAKITGSFYNTPWEIELTNKELKTGKLKKKSYIDSGFLFTIEKSIIKRSIAEINDNRMMRVSKNIEKILKMENPPRKLQ